MLLKSRGCSAASQAEAVAPGPARRREALRQGEALRVFGALQAAVAGAVYSDMADRCGL